MVLVRSQGLDPQKLSASSGWQNLMHLEAQWEKDNGKNMTKKLEEVRTMYVAEMSTIRKAVGDSVSEALSRATEACQRWAGGAPNGVKWRDAIGSGQQNQWAAIVAAAKTELLKPENIKAVKSSLTELTKDRFFFSASHPAKQKPS